MDDFFGNTGFRKSELLDTLHRVSIETILSSSADDVKEEIIKLDAIYNYIKQA